MIDELKPYSEYATCVDRRSPELQGDLRSTQVARSGDRATTRGDRATTQRNTITDNRPTRVSEAPDT